MFYFISYFVLSPIYSCQIITELETKTIKSKNETEMVMENRSLLRKEIGKVFQEIRQKFGDISWIEREKGKIRKAILFEANKRFIDHPYDLRGLRHAKYFQESLYDYLDGLEHLRGDKCWHHENFTMSAFLKLKDFGRRHSPTRKSLSYAKVVLGILTMTILVAAYDYSTDFVVLKVFRNLGKMLPSCQDDFSKIILFKFQGPSVFLGVIFIFSLIFVPFQVPSIWYQYKVTIKNI